MAPDHTENGYTQKEWLDAFSDRVLEQFKYNRMDHKDFQKKFDMVLQEIATLKVKSGVWGLVGGLIPVALMVGFLLIKSQGQH